MALIPRLILAALIGGFLYRLRGGGFVHTGRTQLARAFWAPTGALVAWLAGAPLWAVAAALVPAFLSTSLIGHAGHQDMGTVKSTDPWAPKDGEMFEWVTAPLSVIFGKESGYLADILGLAMIGAVRAAMIVAVPAYWTPDILWAVPTFAVLHPLAYALARELYAIRPWGPDHLGYAEVLTGAAFWSMVVGISPWLSV